MHIENWAYESKCHRKGMPLLVWEHMECDPGMEALTIYWLIGVTTVPHKVLAAKDL